MHDPIDNDTPDPAPQPPPGPTPVPPPPAATATVLDELPGPEQKQWAMFAHLSALVGGLITSGVGGWGVFIGPLVIWLVKKDTMPFVNDQGKEALNFNITVAIVAFGLLLLTIFTLGIGIVLTAPAGIALAIAWLVLTIVGAVKSSNGEYYRYPATLRLVK